MKGKELERLNDLKKLIAIALKYNPSEHMAPVIIAKGRGVMAKNMIDIAKNEGIYVENMSEVAEVLEKYSVSEYIPVEVYSVVAEILIKVFKKRDG